MTTFASVGIRQRTCDALARHGITEPKNIQTEALPVLLPGNDAVIEAPTGSGKTLAFVIPLVERLSGHATGGARALIITPTRELASQVNDVIRVTDRGLLTCLLVGGVGYGKQTGQLRNSPDVIVGCPGRILDLANQGVANLSRINYLVLDEADEMLDQGFARDVERILALLPRAMSGTGRQTVLASATMPAWVQTMIDKHLYEPVRVRSPHEEVPDLEHAVLGIARDAKLDALGTLLKRQATTELPQTLVFHRTKHGAKKLTRDLLALGHRVGELQGNLSQNARDRAIGDFKNGQTTVLVATNVAARGIDVVNVGLVVNFELPETAQWLTHRIGRTARNGRSGRAITMITPEDDEQWRKLRRFGAPMLPHLDARELLDNDVWTYLDVPDVLSTPTPQRQRTAVAETRTARPRSDTQRRPRPATDRRTDGPARHRSDAAPAQRQAPRPTSRSEAWRSPVSGNSRPAGGESNRGAQSGDQRPQSAQRRRRRGGFGRNVGRPDAS